jgi:AcrR family transcriptional regulator
VASSAVQATRNSILDATDRLMARYGFRKTTMEDIAREAGVGRRTIYLHFKGKEDVGLSSIGRVVEGVHDELERILASPQSATCRLRSLLLRRVLGRVERIQDYYHSLDELFEVVRPAYLARRNRYFELELQMLERLLVEGRNQGEFDFEDASATGRSMLLATNAFLPYSLSVRELGELSSIEAQASAMIDLLLRGVAVPLPASNKLG